MFLGMLLPSLATASVCGHLNKWVWVTHLEQTLICVISSLPLLDTVGTADTADTARIHSVCLRFTVSTCLHPPGGPREEHDLRVSSAEICS